MTIILLLSIFSLSSVSTLTTIDKLRSQPLVSEAYIAAQNEACDTHHLCNYQEMHVAALCGSDGRTYNSMCEIKRAACHGNPVVKQMDGLCPASSKCRLERRFQQAMSIRKNSSAIFMPDCDEKDGAYSIVQCHQSTGYCWCVTKNGRPLPGTSVRNKRPNCLPLGKVGRRSSRRRLERQKRGCTTLDRSTFNNNLLKIFQSEYERDPSNIKFNKHQRQRLMSLEKRVLLWKFAQLDRNANGRLSRREFRNQKRLIRKLLQPRACARKFSTHCDLDRDKKLSRREWMTCLGVDIAMSYRLFSSLSSSRRHYEHTMQNDRSGDLQSASEWAAVSGSAGDFFLKEHGKSTVEPSESVDEDYIDCRSQREKTMSSHLKNPNDGVYVPTCTGENDILFDQVQCHKQTHYCWCVKPESGEPIPNTSIQHAHPDCDRPSTKIRRIKSCKPRKQAKFYKRLFSTFETEMIMAAVNPTYDESMSNEEKATRWKFRSLDVNNSNRLERREWKSYRNEMKHWNRVRRCGRNFLRFCDVDGNKKITLHEWLQCTIRADHPSPIPPSSKGRIRKNPFIHILKAD